MNHEQRKAKISWHCRRGMLELDVLLGRFLQSKLDTMSDQDMDVFEALLTHADPDLYAWLMGYEAPSTKELADFVALIRSVHHHSMLP